MRPSKITEAILTRVTEVARMKREVPTIEQLSVETGVSSKTLYRLLNEASKKLDVPRGTSSLQKNGSDSPSTV